MKTEELEKTLARIQDWIKAADQKISILLSLEAVLIAVVGPSTISWYRSGIDNLHLWNYVLLALGLLLLIWSLVSCARGLLPRTTRNTQEVSLTFFGDIAKLSLDGYKKRLATYGVTDYENDLVEQIHTNSKIAVTKFMNMSTALTCFMFCLIPFLLAYLFS